MDILGLKTKDIFLTSWLTVLTIGWLSYTPDNSGIFTDSNSGSTVDNFEVDYGSNRKLVFNANTTAAEGFGIESTSSSQGKLLYVFGSGVPRMDFFSNSSNSAYSGQFVAKRMGSTGTLSTPTNVGASHTVFRVAGQAYQSGWRNTGIMEFQTGSSWGTGNHHGKFRIGVTENGGTNFSDRLVIDGDEIEISANTTLRLPQFSSAPSGPTTGMIYYNTTDNETYVYNGSTWEQITP